MENKSEVARLRERIERECEAIRRVFEEPAIVASHASIEARYRNLQGLSEELKPHVGEQEATHILVEVYKEVVG